jgi:hypothetical protein
MNTTADCPLNHDASLNAPSEVFERVNEKHPTMDGFIEHDRDLGCGWDSFPGLLPA